MSSTGADLVTNNASQVVPQAYVPSTGLYKAIAAKAVGSSEYALESYAKGRDVTDIQTVTITSGQSLSGVFEMGGLVLAAIEMSTGWDTASITLKAASSSGGTFNPVYDDQGNEVTIQAAASRMIGIDAAGGALAALRWVKIQSGTNATNVTQTGTRTLSLILKG